METEPHYTMYANEHPLDYNRRVLYVLLIVTLILRIVYVLSLNTEPVRYDADTYDTIARNILRHGAFSWYYPRPTAYVTPGYPLFLAGIYALFGESNFAAVRVIQAILSVGIIMFIFQSVRQITPNSAAPWIAAAFCILYLPFTEVNQFILTEVLFSFVLAVCFHAMILAEKYRCARYWIWFGAMLGLSCLVRPILFFLPFAIWIIEAAISFIKKRSQNEGNIPRRTREIILVYLVFILTLSPWIIRNIVAFKAFIPFSTEGGNPLYLGSVYDYKVDEKSMHDKGLGEMEQNRVWVRKAWGNIKRGMSSSPFRYSSWYFSKIRSNSSNMGR